ncbi:DNA internalization-related competence protein ComEC/Rec2 [Parendozoicomonas haliclonae]|nr:DNA internalization-related competence protein ComEC/Rec2 [Parendozoicomonas haliclonae]
MPPYSFWAGCLAVLAAVWIVFRFIRKTAPKPQHSTMPATERFPGASLYHSLFIYLLCLCLGAVYAQWRITYQIDNWLPPSLNRVSLCLTGTVTGLPEVRDERTRFLFKPSLSHSAFKGLLQLSWQDAPVLKPGQVWQLCTRLKRPHGFASPGAGDYEARLMRQGVVATGYVRKEEGCPNRWLEESDSFPVDRWRARLSQWLDEQLGEQSGLVKGLLVGDGRGISPEQWQLFRDTGTVHLLVISGLHISLISGFVWLLVRALALIGLVPVLWVPVPQMAVLLGLLAGVVYGVLAGFGLPVQRALVMLLVGVGSLLLGFRLPLMTLYLLALSAVLIINPLADTAQGFWLSFLAVAILLLAFSHRRGQSRLTLLLVTQLVIAVGLAPAMAFIGQPLTLLSPILNLISILLVGGLLLPLLLLALFIAGLNEVAGVWLLQHVGKVLTLWEQCLAYTVRTMSEVGDNWFIAWPVPDAVAVIFAAVGVGLLLLPGALRLRWLSLFCFLPWLWPANNNPKPGVAEMAVLDVGQGLSVVVRTHQHVLVYDTGDRFSPDFTAAEAVVIPYLARLGLRPDRIVISHSDRDHIGGLESLEKHFPKAGVVNADGSGEACNPSASWEWDGVQFQFLAGQISGTGVVSANDRSCVLQVCAGDVGVEERCALLTGDITRRREKQLVSEYGKSLRSRLLLVPHHGSQTSSSAEFLAAVSPQWSSISAGYANRFGHPSRVTISGLASSGEVWTTADTGTQIFRLGELSSPVFYRCGSAWWRGSAHVCDQQTSTAPNSL